MITRTLGPRRAQTQAVVLAAYCLPPLVGLLLTTAAGRSGHGGWCVAWALVEVSIACLLVGARDPNGALMRSVAPQILTMVATVFTVLVAAARPASAAQACELLAAAAIDGTTAGGVLGGWQYLLALEVLAAPARNLDSLALPLAIRLAIPASVVEVVLAATDAHLAIAELPLTALPVFAVAACGVRWIVLALRTRRVATRRRHPFREAEVVADPSAARSSHACRGLGATLGLATLLVIGVALATER